MHKYLLLFLLLASLTGCTKTEIVDYEKDAQNKIIEYKVTNAAETIYGIVDDIDKTITVYIPYYLSIEVITPKIKLETGAKLIDKDGQEIDIREDLEPVALGTAGYKYRVKDAAGQIREYTLISKIIPHKDALKLGYSLTVDANNNPIADTLETGETSVNARFYIVGNFESSSTFATVNLIDKKNNKVIPNALKIIKLTRDNQTHTMELHVNAQVDSGTYYVSVEHQGRKATLPSIHISYKKPVFERLAKVYNVGDIVTLNLYNDNTPSGGGINTGVKRAYIKFTKEHFTFPGAYYPKDFPENLFNKPIALEIVSQSRTQIQFKFPDIPVGAYSTSMGTNGTTIQYTGFGFYFDFNSAEWGNDNLLSSINYTIQINAKK